MTLFIHVFAVTELLSQEFTIQLEQVHETCAGDSIILMAPTITGGMFPYTITWTTDSGEVFHQDSLIVVAGISREYCVTVEDANGTVDSSCTIVKSYPTIPATFTLDQYEGCEPMYVVMTSQSEEFQSIEQMIWHYGDGDSTVSLASTNHQYVYDGIYHPWLEILDEHGCITRDTLDIPVRVFPKPHAKFSVSSEIDYLPNTTFEFSNESTDADEYVWIFDEFDTYNGFDTSYAFPLQTTGEYLVELYASNQYGCAGYFSQEIKVEELIELYIPNTFTPDNDGINDVWQVKGSGYDHQHFKIEVFNRWGEQMFSTENPEEAWTGNFSKGTNFVPDGMYFYKVLVKDNLNKVGHLYEGHIYVLR